jgi:hypothetical protein
VLPLQIAPGRSRAAVHSMLASVGAFACALALSSRAQAEEARTDPGRLLGYAAIGVPLRLTVDSALGQDRVAPAFADVLVGYALPGGQFRHGFGLGLSWNMGHDGGYTTPVYAADQFVLMPAYLAHYTLNPDVFALGHVGVPILVRGGSSAGVEIGALLAYRVLAGLGVFGAVNLDGFVAESFNLLASFEVGVVVDYEVLP